LDSNHALRSFGKWMVGSAIVWEFLVLGQFLVILLVVMKVPLRFLPAPFLAVSVVGIAGMMLTYAAKKSLRGLPRNFMVGLAGGAIAIVNALVLAAPGLKRGLLDTAKGRHIFGLLLVSALLVVMFWIILIGWLQELFDGRFQPSTANKILRGGGMILGSGWGFLVLAIVAKVIGIGPPVGTILTAVGWYMCSVGGLTLGAGLGLGLTIEK
jgi:hypothetical protein